MAVDLGTYLGRMLEREVSNARNGNGGSQFIDDAMRNRFGVQNDTLPDIQAYIDAIKAGDPWSQQAIQEITGYPDVASWMRSDRNLGNLTPSTTGNIFDTQADYAVNQGDTFGGLPLLAPAVAGIIAGAGGLTSLADIPTFSGSFDPTLPGVQQVASGGMPTQVAGWYGEAPNLDPNGIWSGNYSAPAETTISEMAGGAATPGQVSPTAWYPGATGATGGWSMPNVGLNDILKYAGPLASLAGGVMGSNAAKSAANTQANAAREAIAAQMAMYGQTRADLTPYREAGAGALSQLRDYTATPDSLLLKPFGMEDFQKSPAYEFNLSEGMRALNHGAAARGGTYYAPATLKSLGDFAQGRASNEFQNAFSNYQTNMGNIWNRLSGLAGMGQNASAQMGSLGANVANNVGSNITGIGNAQAAGQVGGANAISGGMSNAYNAYLMDQILSKNQKSGY